MKLTNVVVFEGWVPHGLRNWVAKNVSERVHLVRQVRDGGLRYEAECRIGWACRGKHVAVAHTTADMIAALGTCVPCKCARCGGGSKAATRKAPRAR